MTFSPKAFFSQTKQSILRFIVLAVFFYAVIAFATQGIVIRKCASCPVNWPLTLMFYLFSLGALYFLYCWILHVWKKAVRR